jgi:hypothetical protein
VRCSLLLRRRLLLLLLVLLSFVMRLCATSVGPALADFGSRARDKKLSLPYR